jgi:hypothetical protein
MRVRAKNTALFVVIAFSIVGAYFILGAIVNSWLTPLPKGVVSANAMLLHHLPGFLVAYGVLAAGGMALAMFVDSAVPLKWCLGLGAVFALLYLSVGIFGLVKYAATGASLAPSVLIVATISFSYLVVPIVGGYIIKRRFRRVAQTDR